MNRDYQITNYMKRLNLTIAILIIGSISSFAQDAKYKATLKTMLQVGGTEETFKTAISQMFGMFRQQRSEVPVEIWNELEKSMSQTSLDELVDMFAPIYFKHITQAEMEEIIKFYRTPAGKKLAEKTPAITQESMEVGQQWGMKIGQAVMEKLKEKGY
jgi:hypothetical protein